MSHTEAHPLAGATVMLESHPDDHLGLGGPVEYRIEDYYDRVTGRSWMFAEGNPAAIKYAIRAGLGGLPADDEVVYGKVGPFGHIVHVSELGDEV